MKKIVVFLAISVSLILLLGLDGSNLKLQDTECKCEPEQWIRYNRQNISKYAIVRASELDTLQTDVNDKLKKGWHLIGGISIVDSNSFCQVMVK